MGEGGGRIERIRRGEPLLVEIDYRANSRIEDPIFGFSVTKSDGTLCCGSNTIIDEYPVPFIEGAGTVRLRFQSLPLIQGKYYFSFSMHARDHKTNYHRMYNWFSIWVDCARKAEGMVNLGCKWESGSMTNTK